MYSTTFIFLSGITVILYFIYLFIIEEQKKKASNQNKYWTVKDDKGGVYFVKNLQMNVVNNFVEEQKAEPIYVEERINNNYTKSYKSIVDSVIN